MTKAEMRGNETLRQIGDYPPTKTEPESNDHFYLFRMTDHLEPIASFLQKQTLLTRLLSSGLAKRQEGMLMIEELMESIHLSNEQEAEEFFARALFYINTW